MRARARGVVGEGMNDGRERAYGAMRARARALKCLSFFGHGAHFKKEQRVARLKKASASLHSI
jgi:hypothetical protein